MNVFTDFIRLATYLHYVSSHEMKMFNVITLLDGQNI